jgi:hypothetical protein
VSQFLYCEKPVESESIGECFGYSDKLISNLVPDILYILGDIWWLVLSVITEINFSELWKKYNTHVQKIYKHIHKCMPKYLQEYIPAYSHI